MSVSSPFIQRPIATSLLGVAVMLGGVLGYPLDGLRAKGGNAGRHDRDAVGKILP
jgi:hypothetical protein